MFRSLPRGQGLIVAAALALLVGVPAAQASSPRSRAERAFLTEMVGHHAMAVDMARMAQERATHPELRSMADDIVRSQSAEINRMQSWLRRWYGKSANPKMNHEEMQQMEELERAASPAEFEIRFMALMTMHHTQALERARAIRERRVHGKTRRLARDIIRAQEREIEQMRSWLVAWYAN
jgi:uncharacterized protein (DUF305 family)